MEFRFLPALLEPSAVWAPGGSQSRQYIGPKREPPLQPVAVDNWMDEDLHGTHAYYPHALISYYIWRDHPVQWPTDGFIFGDSGGFSVMRYTVSRVGGKRFQQKLDPTDIVRWQNEVCNAGVLLDVPPGNLTKKRIWKRALPKTVSNTKKGLILYEQLRAQGTEFRWWGVVHGWMPAHWDVWWRKISEVYPFTDEGEGWAMRIRPTAWDPVGIAHGLRWLQQHKITRTHFLMAGNPTSIAVLLVLGDQTDLQSITCDATTAGRAAINRTVWRPDKPFKFKLVTEREQERTARDYLLEKCECFSCDGIRRDAEHSPDDILHGEYGQYWIHRFSFHNHILQLAQIKKLKEAAKDNPDGLLRELLGNSYGATLRAFDGTESIPHAQGMPRSLLDHI